jgi:tRNA wybutosine-synthesizing protein 3
MPPSIPRAFAAKKSKIVAQLSQSTNSYADNSPKGSVDVQIVDLINEINAYDGLVTTSSCAGRAAVFVEGRRNRTWTAGNGEVERDGGLDGEGDVLEADDRNAGKIGSGGTGVWKGSGVTASPGGKGGGRWLFVSHDPIIFTTTEESSPDYFSKLLGLAPPKSIPLQAQDTRTAPQIVHLTFSPLILHIHCATLQHAKPLLAAAINSGFRESGVQSLKILDQVEVEKGTGVMVAIRTAGLNFSSVVGIAHVVDEVEQLRQVVSEEYLRLCVGVINERFWWNDERRERFRVELTRAMTREGFVSAYGTAENASERWEDKDDRRRRKEAEGLARQREARKEVSTIRNGESVLDSSINELEQNLSIFDDG